LLGVLIEYVCEMHGATMKMKMLIR